MVQCTENILDNMKKIFLIFAIIFSTTAFAKKNDVVIPKYFSKENNIYTFKEDIVFNKNRFSLNVQQFLEIFPLNQRKEMLKKILKTYKNLISIDVEDYNPTKDSIILKNFFKSVELYTKIIDNYLELIAKK